ncbi:MAG TPA: chaperonin GroEL [Candidatus Eisenbacteria bacterium]|nr:chaperonin GroEL [Candidatus Eisenbacteria bacterium]
MPKRLVFDARAREALRRGVDQMADAVKVTLGPRGRHVILDKKVGAPTVTNDGVTIAREIELPDPFENAGAQLVREVASRTNDVAGDGTTTATVLAQAVVRGGLRAVAAGANPMQLKRGIDRAVEAVVRSLADQSRKVESRQDIARVATIAANQDPQVGELVADAMEKIGRDGVITVEEARGMETKLDVVEGMLLDKGYVSPYFVSDAENMRAELVDAYLLLTDRKVSALEDLLPVLQVVLAQGKPILVIADEIEGEALAALVVNKLRGVLATCAVKAPAFGDRRRAILEDLAVLTGARLITEDQGLRLDKAGLEDLGRVRRAVITRDDTTLIGGAGAKQDIEARVAQIKKQLDEADSDYDKEKLRERLARLTSGVAVLEVGAATELELKERRSRIEDAIAATRAAVEEGVLPGGGVALLRALPAVAEAREALSKPDERMGAEVIARSLEEPARWIAANAGAEGASVVAELKSKSGPVGYNASTGVIEDLMAAGVIDPAKVVRVALVHAASIGSLVLTADALVVEKPEEDKPNG